MTTRLILLVLLNLFFAQINAQRSAPQPLQNTDFSLQTTGDTKWIIPKTNTAKVSVAEFFISYHTALGLSQDDNFVLEKTNADKYGWEHHRMQQYHRGIKVLGAEYILHSKNGYVEMANGKLATRINAPLHTGISANQAIAAALKYLPAERYMWDIPTAEARLQKITKNKQATHYPSPELVLVDREYPKHTGHYLLAYMLDVSLAEPFRKERVFVEAYAGHIIQSFNTLDHGAAAGVAKTRYNGERGIITDSIAPQVFVLRDRSRAAGIFIQNNDNCSGLEIFRDEDNYWDNYNKAQDEVATDVLFGIEAAYDYFLHHFDLDSYDGNGAAMHAQVHYGMDYSNAAWNGREMLFGDGNGKTHHPFTSFDLVVHEFMHAVTEHSANLVYRGEPGALNEGFSDVFSKLVEQEYLPEKLSWRLAGDIFIDSTANDAIRVMDDPNVKNKPAYYGGEYWYDSGGVHTNSAIMNYWFTLLCDGKAGTNEVGMDYDISAIGFEKMGKICYRMLSTYLTSTSNYEDAVIASLQSARDIYGECATETDEILKAWNAVGLGLAMQEDEVLLQASLGESYCELVDFSLKTDFFLNACDAFIPQGTVLHFYYQINNETEVHEQDTLAFDLNGLETYTYHFNSLMTLNTYEQTSLHLKVEYSLDSIQVKQEDIFSFQHNRAEDIDIFLFSPNLNSGDCGFYEDKYLTLFMSYQKCEQLQVGYTLPIKIEVDSMTYYHNFTLEADYLSNFIFLNLDIPEGITGSGKKDFFVTIMDENDIDTTNNTARLNAILYEPFEAGFIKDFSAIDSNWEANISGSVNTNFSIEEIEGNPKFVATGDILEDLYWFRSGCEGTKEEIFNANSIVVTDVPICVDFAGCRSAQLEFDLIQTKGNADYLSEGIDTEFTVMALVSASKIDQPSSRRVISDIIINPVMGEEFHHIIDLGGLSMTDRILTIELFALSNEEGLLNGDNNIIDNIQITGCQAVAVQETAIPKFSLYPNPVSNLLFIEGKEAISRLVLLDNKGAIIREYTGNARKIELGEGLDAGIYYVQITSAQGISYLKLVKI